MNHNRRTAKVLLLAALGGFALTVLCFGLGAYHGVWGFREFTHPSAVLFGKTKMNLPLREHPYSGKGKWKERIVKIAEK